MKRSEINRAVLDAIELLEKNNLKLPMFGYWKLDEWRANKELLGNINEIMLGWDITDFGSGNFLKNGATLFTIRNGSLNNPEAGTPYAEKLIFMKHETRQEIPFHFHEMKTEDIINRGGGTLVLELYNSTQDGKLDKEKEIRVKMDGIIRTLPAGAVVEIEKGCSITLPPGLYHSFWAKQGGGDLIVGEVSSVNDDNTDNVFLEDIARFAEIDEDEGALYPLCNEIQKLV